MQSNVDWKKYTTPTTPSLHSWIGQKEKRQAKPFSTIHLNLSGWECPFIDGTVPWRMFDGSGESLSWKASSTQRAGDGDEADLLSCILFAPEEYHPPGLDSWWSTKGGNIYIYISVFCFALRGSGGSAWVQQVRVRLFTLKQESPRLYFW